MQVIQDTMNNETVHVGEDKLSQCIKYSYV